MQKLISTLLLILLFSASIAAEDNTPASMGIPITIEKNKSINRYPQAPARIPVVCSHDDIWSI